MNEALEITPYIHDTIFVFALNLPDDEVAAFTEAGAEHWPLKTSLGAAALDPSGVEVLASKDMTGLGLTGLLVEGHGMDRDAVSADKARLDALQGHVVLVHASAFQGVAQDLSPGPELTFIGRYSGPRTATPVEPIRSKSAQGTLQDGKAKPSDARVGGRIAMIALLVLLLLVGLMIWIA